MIKNSGKIYVVGIGPGSEQYVCPAALQAMQNSDVIVGYKTYIALVEQYIKGKEMMASAMMKEVDRCQQVLEMAQNGKVVSLVSSGDPGVYGMAGIMLEMVAAQVPELEVEIIPGVSAASAAASLLGAPLMLDYVVLSLSDLLAPWNKIVKRLHAAGVGDFVVALYNPRSKKRVQQLVDAVEILLQYQTPETPVGIVKHAMREQQEVIHTTLNDVLHHDIDMFTTLIIGNSQTHFNNGKMITQRGYSL